MITDPAFPLEYPAPTPGNCVKYNTFARVSGDTHIYDALPPGTQIGHGCTVTSYDYYEEIASMDGESLARAVAASVQHLDLPSDTRIQIGVLRDTSVPCSGAHAQKNTHRLGMSVWSHSSNASALLTSHIERLVKVNENESCVASMRDDVAHVTQLEPFAAAISSGRETRDAVSNVIASSLGLTGRSLVADVVQRTIQKKEGEDGYIALMDYNSGGDAVVFRSPVHGTLVFKCETDEGTIMSTATEGWRVMPCDPTPDEARDGWVSLSQAIDESRVDGALDSSCVTLSGSLGTRFIDPRASLSNYPERRYGSSFARVVQGKEQRVSTYILDPIANVFGPVSFDYSTQIAYGSIALRGIRGIIHYAPPGDECVYFPCGSIETRGDLFDSVFPKHRGLSMDDSCVVSDNGGGVVCRKIPIEWFKNKRE